MPTKQLLDASEQKTTNDKQDTIVKFLLQMITKYQEKKLQIAKEADEHKDIIERNYQELSNSESVQPAEVKKPLEKKKKKKKKQKKN